VENRKEFHKKSLPTTICHTYKYIPNVPKHQEPCTMGFPPQIRTIYMMPHQQKPWKNLNQIS